ncbi:hypothetical protein, partial [Escherichia coli]|uniref:hypothetical protein n=1 Tax=Escherichia coli TaxID=562 RepID=UPI001BD650C4
MRILYTSVEEKFPGAGYRAIGALFFLRFLCPILVSPITFGAIKEKYSPLAWNAQRGLVLVAKLIQNIANESTDFGKQHEFMKPFTNLVQKHTRLMREFYDTILRAEGPTLRSRIPCTPHQ